MNGRASPRGSRSARGSWTSCWPTSTDRSSCSRAGTLPPEIVFAHPGFLRACVGNRTAPAVTHLPLYAADLVRGARRPPRRSWPIARSAPSGAGYALENRIVLSRALPEVFASATSSAWRCFFRTMRDTLRRIAPHNRDNPRIVLLTPGPYNATYFEQAFLAQYLGYTLVKAAISPFATTACT